MNHEKHCGHGLAYHNHHERIRVQPEKLSIASKRTEKTNTAYNEAEHAEPEKSIRKPI